MGTLARGVPMRFALVAVLAAVSLAAAVAPTSRRAFVLELADDAVVPHAARSVASGTDPRAAIRSPAASAYADFLAGEHDAVLARAAAAARGVRPRRRLRLLANAVTVDAPADAGPALAALPGVRRVTPVRRYTVSVSTSVPLIQAPAVSSPLGAFAASGAGVRIAIVDSGIDVRHPFFASSAPPPSGFPRGVADLTNGKVIVARAFLDDPIAPPVDENGHGTNVASIAAGAAGTATPLGVLRGVAPGALLGNYRAFDGRGEGTNDHIVAAIEAAFADDFQVVNLSFGSRPAQKQDQLLIQAIANAVAGGMTVVVAAGNAGPRDGTIDSPGIAGAAITVAATTNAHTFGTVLGVDGDDVPPALGAIRAQPAPGSLRLLPSEPLPYAEPGSTTVARRACRRLAGGTLAGRAALVERGGCSFRRKVRNATRAGARAVIVYNAAGGRGGGEALVTMSIGTASIPALFIGRQGGVALRERLVAAPDTRVRVRTQVELPQAADVVTRFSARGPTRGGDLKPDLAAPGAAVFGAAVAGPNSAGVTGVDGFSAVDGTSQAAAHVSGAAALLRQIRPDWTPGQIKSALTSSALPVVLANGARAGVLDAGSGRIDVARAAATPVTFEPSSVTVRVRRPRDAPATSELAILATNVRDVPLVLSAEDAVVDGPGGATVALERPTLTLAPGATAAAALRVTVAPRARRGPRTGVIVFRDAGGTPSRVPVLVLVE